MRPIPPKRLEYPRFVTEGYAEYYAPIEGQKLTVPLGYIPQVEHTFQFFDAVNALLNERQLGMGEGTVGSRTSGFSTKSYTVRPTPEAGWFTNPTLNRVAQERCTTAREAVKLMGDLAVNHGFYLSGETLSVIDPNEGWMFHVLATPELGSAVWAAQRVPDDEVSAQSNTFTIREIDLNNPDYFMASDNVFEIAEEQGWWDPKEPFDFKRAYDRVRAEPSWSDLRRRWRIYDTLAPSREFEPWVDHYTKEYPFSIKPEKKVSVQDLFAIYRDSLEGTEFDRTVGPAAGPFGTPGRFGGGAGEKEVKGRWERPVSVKTASYSYIIQVRDWLPDPIGGLVWYGPDAPNTTCYVPFYCGIKELPVSYQIGSKHKFTRDSAWWAFDFINNFADLKYSYMIKDINALQEQIEGKQFAMQPAIEAAALELYKKDPDLAKEFLTQYCVNNANDVVAEFWELADLLIAKYNDGRLNIPGVKIGKGVGYPAWWLEQVEYGPIEPPETEAAPE